jgi:hypothetical protein
MGTVLPETEWLNPELVWMQWFSPSGESAAADSFLDV